MDYLIRPIENVAVAERLHRLARRIQDENDIDVMNVGLRAAKARDRQLLQVLERMTEFLVAEGGRQYGETVHAQRAMNVLPPECNVWRAAYEACDRGSVRDAALAPMYGAAAVWAGLAHKNGAL